MPQYIGSSAPLVTGTTYTSPWVNSDIYGAVTGSIFTDQVGTLYIEQSGDKVNADISASYSVSANQGSGFNEQLLLPYLRLRVHNSSGSDQTVLRLFSRYMLGEMP